MKVEQIYTGCLTQGAYYIRSGQEAAISTHRCRVRILCGRVSFHDRPVHAQGRGWDDLIDVTGGFKALTLTAAPFTKYACTLSRKR